MQQLFNTRNYSVRDFEEWKERGELVLAPKFQRREVWNAKAKSYLVDTILRGKPIPKLYMRQNVNPANRRTTREIVDGQQRLSTVLSFIKDGFKISKTHNEDFGGRFFSGLDQETQKDILKYEFVVDLLQDMPDPEVYDVFARINTYGEKLKPQESRNAKYFGEFKTCVYSLAKDWVSFLEANTVFSSKAILRMAEAEFISDLVLAMEEGIREGNKRVLDKAYKDYDDDFPNRKRHEKRFAETFDTIRDVLGDDLPKLRFKGIRLLYPLFCALYHLHYGLPRLKVPRKTIKTTDYPKVKAALEAVDDLIGRIKAAEDAGEDISVSVEDRKFYDAWDEHTVHAAKRTLVTQYLCKRIVKALK
ncbi:MAG TPA: DUF262 domain-containing protein [Vicinamibacterales bacterium]|nr:DUF262 domain-containing protein [Vicinamibacterales bacterium]